MRRLNRRLLAAWAVLSAITLIYVWIDDSADHHGTAHAGSAVTVLALLLAALKVRIIMREFMEVRNAPVLLCRLTDAWIGGMSVAMIGFYLAGRAVAT